MIAKIVRYAAATIAVLAITRLLGVLIDVAKRAARAVLSQVQ